MLCARVFRLSLFLLIHATVFRFVVSFVIVCEYFKVLGDFAGLRMLVDFLIVCKGLNNLVKFVHI